MSELNNYSGPFRPDLTFNDLSKDFLLKVIRIWQWSWLQMDAGWFENLKDKVGQDIAHGCDLEMWLRCAERCNTRYAKIAKIPLKNAVDCLKVLQLPLDNTMGAVYPTTHEIRNENYAVITVQKCPSLEFCERSAPERVVPMCVIMEPHLIHWYKVNTDVMVAATKLPPRKSADETACQWVYSLQAPKGARVKATEEVVDETDSPPEIDDMSGKYYPHLTHANFSKAFLLKMMTAWQYAWLVMNEGYYFAVMRRFGQKMADECEAAAWLRVAERTNKRYAPVGEFKLETVTDSLKVMQLCMDSTMGFFPAKYDVKSPNHVVMKIGKGKWPAYMENAMLQRTPPMYHDGGKPILEKYLVNPKIKVTPLRVPPRNEYDDIDCEWELKIE
jgi:hypothetical protein